MYLASNSQNKYSNFNCKSFSKSSTTSTRAPTLPRKSTTAVKGM